MSTWQRLLGKDPLRFSLINRHFLSTYCIVVVQSVSRVWLFVTAWTAAYQASLPFTISQSLLKLMSIEAMMLSIHLVLCYPLLLLPSIFPSIRIFSNESALYQMAKVLELQLKHQSFQWIFGLISFSIDWFDLLAVQGTLQCLLQCHNSKASIIWRLSFFIVQLSQLYMTTGKIITLTIRTFVIKVTSAF